MLVSKLLLPLALLTTGSAVLAADEAAAIYSSLETINSDTAALGTTVTAWDGGLLGSLPIVAQSAALLAAIDNGTTITQSSDPLSAIEAVTVAGAVVQLVAGVNATLDALVAAQPRFDALLLGPVVLLDLQLEKDATDRLSAALEAKVPSDLVAAAQALAAEIDAAFSQAIAAYETLSL